MWVHLQLFSACLVFFHTSEFCLALVYNRKESGIQCVDLMSISSRARDLMAKTCVMHSPAWIFVGGMHVESWLSDGRIVGTMLYLYII
jgi:hypothetical protein